jgi:hypothetical protein
MDAHLTAPTTPTTLIDGYTTDEEVIFWVRCHDRHLQNITIADNSGEKLFYVEGRGAYKSWTFRRPLKDPSSAPVFDLRRYGTDIKFRWFVDDANGNKIAELSHKNFFTRAHTAIDAHVFKDDVRAEMRPRDFSAATTYVNVNGAIIAEINLHMNNTPKRFIGDQDASVFRVRVAKGVDLSLVCLAVSDCWCWVV